MAAIVGAAGLEPTLEAANAGKRLLLANKEALVDDIRQVLSEFPGIVFSYTQPIEMRTSEMLTGSRGDLAVKIFGPDLTTLGTLAAQIQATISKVKGAREVVTVANDQVEYLEFAIDRVAAGRTGMNINALQDELRSRLEGTPAGLVNEPGRRTSVVIRGEDNLRTDPDLFARTQLVTPDGGLVRIGDIARIVRSEGRVRIDHENASRFAVIQAYVAGRDLVGFVQDALGDFEDRHARWCYRNDPFAVAHENFHAQFILEQADLFADARLRGMQFLGRHRQIESLLADFDQVA